MKRKTQHVRFGELIPCRTAFIDTHNPGTEGKENFTIIGGGVSENSEQYVHIDETPGFNIGGAGQPAGSTNSLHSHRTAEIFIIHKGYWRFFWGLEGDDGEVVLHPGDLITLPTHMFRGFENITANSDTDSKGYGFMFSVLGGDDSGGGVVWAPQVLATAQQHGLVLLESGQLIDVTNGESVPDDVVPLDPVSGAELAYYSRNTISDSSKVVARRPGSWMHTVTEVIGKNSSAAIRERPGFEVVRVHWDEDETVPWRLPMVDTALILNAGSAELSNGVRLGHGDVVLLHGGDERVDVQPANGARSELFVVIPTDDLPGETRLE